MITTFALFPTRLIDHGQEIADAALVVRNGKILYAGPRQGYVQPAEMPLIAASDYHVSPGLIDLQFNGGYGHDFTQDPGSLLEVARRLPETGVVSFLPTFITSPITAYAEKLAGVAAAQRNQAADPAEGAKILGAHVEGPFLNPAKKGAHRQEFFSEPVTEALEQLQPIDAVRLLTLAPEMPHGLEAVRWLRERNVVVSIGHSAASSEETLQAVEAGVTCATHLYNAMRGMESRNPGLVGTLLADGAVYCGLIVDGIHVHPQMVKLAYRCLGSKRIFLVTDAMAAMGMPAGKYPIGDQTVIVDAVSARLADGTLAGSILTLDQAVRNMVRFSGCTAAEALSMATTTPAAVLGLDGQAGCLHPGCPADLTLFDEFMNLQATFVDGNLVYAVPAARELLSSLL